MALEARPFVGTYQLNNRVVVKHTPDALCYFNGDLSIPGCPTCGGRIDLQPYITEVSVDPTVEGPATANISLHVPRHAGDALVRDGSFIIRPGLEVNIYFRGYFPVTGLVSQTPDQTGGIDLTKSVMYPYYQVFHGVVIDVNYSYASGEHTASLSCADLLHFWQFQRISSSGSAFGSRPANSKVRMSLVGHNLTGMSPYAIIYTLFRDVAGAAGGVEFALGSASNNAANSSAVGESIFSLTMLYWQKRFSQSTQNLRMFGADGTLYSADEASFLAQLTKGQLDALKSFKQPSTSSQSNSKDPLVKVSDVQAAAELLNLDFASIANTLYSAKSEDSKGLLTVNVADISSFVSDVGNWGNVNLFESEYQTKTEISTTVKTAVGFEFYQDVDGDLVFKPPFYNMDTSSSRVYRIEPVDVISVQTAEKEPEATVVKATGSWFKNLKVPGIDGWVGTRGQYVDYRLVAQFGWREQTYETSYHTNPAAMFFSAISRLDLFNIGIKSATLTIPIRPELRPGYPVYIVHLDCYYYIQSMSHSFSYGGQCTTSLNLVGRRAKFHAPGTAPADGKPATVANIDLANTHSPSLPLTVIGNEGIPRVQGFPNVVMTLDPQLVNPLTFSQGISVDDIKSEDDVAALIKQALFSRQALLQQVPDSGTTDQKTKALGGPFQIQTGNNTPAIIIDNLQTLVTQATTLAPAYTAKNKTTATIAAAEESAAAIVALISAAQDVHQKNFPEEGSTASYLELVSDQKAAFNPGLNLPGYYRYYSSSHPNVGDQGPLSLDIATDVGTVKTKGTHFELDPKYQGQSTVGFSGADGSFPLDGKPNVTVNAGIPIPTRTAVVVTPTYAITSFTMAQFDVAKINDIVVTLGHRSSAFPSNELAFDLAIGLRAQMENPPPPQQLGLSITLETFRPLFDAQSKALKAKLSSISGVPPIPPGSGSVPDFEFPINTTDSAGKPVIRTTLGDVDGDGVDGKARAFALEMGVDLALKSSISLFAVQNALASPTDDQVLAITGTWGALYSKDSLNQRRYENPGSDQAKAETASGKKTLKYVVPVFPVSDERGYEVVGTYRYGRGLSIEPGGNFETLRASSLTENTSYDAVDDKVSKALHGTAPAKAVSSNSTPEQAGAALADADGSSDTAGDTLNLGGDAQTTNAYANRTANANESTQKTTVVNAAYSLADLSSYVNKFSVCSCKGAEADVLLQAFQDDLFVTTSLTTDVTDTDNVQEWLEDQAAAQSVGWAAVQGAYRGTAIDTRGMAPWSAAGDAINTFGTLLGAGSGASAGEQIGAAVTDGGAALRAIKADLAASKAGN